MLCITRSHARSWAEETRHWSEFSLLQGQRLCLCRHCQMNRSKDCSQRMDKATGQVAARDRIALARILVVIRGLEPHLQCRIDLSAPIPHSSESKASKFQFRQSLGPGQVVAARAQETSAGPPDCTRAHSLSSQMLREVGHNHVPKASILTTAEVHDRHRGY